MHVKILSLSDASSYAKSKDDWRTIMQYAWPMLYKEDVNVNDENSIFV